MDLTKLNPWWNENGLWQDPDLVRVKESLLDYRPRPFEPHECSQNAVLTLRGPRRVGKTVSLKLLVAELIERQGWNPKRVTWTAFDTLRTLDQAESHLVAIEDQYKPKLLLIDEVTSVIGWQRVIKKLRDDGTLAGACVILTGSSAHDLKAGAERMAGRRGDIPNPDRVLLPMSFPEFRRQTARHNVECSDYLKVGGFPFRVEGFLRKRVGYGEPWSEFDGFQIFDDVLFYEFARRKLDRSIALEVMGRLSAVGAGALSYEAFAKPLSVAKDTARKYLDALGDAFLLATISSYDTARARVAPKKGRKFVWIDSALGYSGQWLRSGPAVSEASMAEFAVGTELLRRFEARIWEGLSAPRNVFTWKSSGGNEVDFLVVDRSQKLLFPVEVKWRNQLSDWDFQVIERAFGRGWIVTPRTGRKRPKAEAMGLSEFFERSLPGERRST